MAFNVPHNNRPTEIDKFDHALPKALMTLQPNEVYKFDHALPEAFTA